MRSLGMIALCIGLATAGFSAGADDVYVIKTKEYTPGDKLSVERTSNATVWVKAGELKALGASDQEVKVTGKAVYWEEILGKDKLRRGYGAARLTAPDKNVIMPYEGKIVDIEKVNDKYIFTIDKKRLSAQDAGELETEFNKIKSSRTQGGWSVLANVKAKLDETFTFDAQPLLQDMDSAGLEIAPGKVYAAARLQKVYEKDQRRFGSLLVHIEVPVKSMRQDATNLPLESGAKLVVQSTYDGCIDGTSHDATIKSIAHMNGNALVKTFKIPMVVRVNEQQTIKERKE